MEAAAIVLAGGRSSRMGSPKAALEWHRSTLLHRVCGICSRALGGQVIVVAAADQELPRLPAGTKVVRDVNVDRGPLEGLAVGLDAAAEYGSVAFVSATDVPFLHPLFIRAVVDAMGPDTDIALPDIDGFPQPLAAAYRVSVAPLAAELVAAGRLQFRALFGRAQVRRIDGPTLLADERFAAHDPRLDSILSLDDVDEYTDARSRPAPPVTVERLGSLIRDHDSGPRPVRAATLEAAASAAGVEMTTAIAVTVDDRPIVPDPEFPLIPGDRVAFTRAE